MLSEKESDCFSCHSFPIFLQSGSFASVSPVNQGASQVTYQSAEYATATATTTIGHSNVLFYNYYYMYIRITTSPATVNTTTTTTTIFTFTKYYIYFSNYHHRFNYSYFTSITSTKYLRQLYNNTKYQYNNMYFYIYFYTIISITCTTFNSTTITTVYNLIFCLFVCLGVFRLTRELLTHMEILNFFKTKNGVTLLQNLAPSIFTFYKDMYFLAKITRYLFLYFLHFHIT